MFRKKRPAVPPARTPHPDPRMEARLQRINALRESAARKGDLARQYAGEVGRLGSTYRVQAANGYLRNADQLEARLKDLQGEMRRLEEEIGAIHEQIAERTAELSDTDLAYL